MSEQTKISWCDSTWNLWSGCTKVSPGCANCYAETMSHRNMGNIGQWGPGAPRRLHESAFKLAERLNRNPWVCDECGRAFPYSQQHKCPTISQVVAFPDETNWHRRRIFSLSLGDWLDPEVPVEWLARMLDTIRRCDRVTWILCTKRPELFFDRWKVVEKWAAEEEHNEQLTLWLHSWMAGRPPQNIWLLVSVENQEMADKRIPELLKIPAAVHGLSVEPLLGPIHLRTALKCRTHIEGNVLLPGINWVIVGGESGPHARPCDVTWIRDIVHQCKAAGVACFVKQFGKKAYQSPESAGGTGYEISLKHPKGGDPAEWPEDLRIREFPK